MKKGENTSLSSQARDLLEDIHRNIRTEYGSEPEPPRRELYYGGLARAIRDRLIERWLQSQRHYYRDPVRRVYYLSMEFLPGRFMQNYITNLQLDDVVEEALDGLYTLEELESEEMDAGLGNGGLGRLASCFLDSMATLNIPGYGYGIRYDYGVFYQTIENGWQVEHADNWIRYGNPWDFKRPHIQVEVNFYGRSEAYKDVDGRLRHRWVDTETVKALPYDTLIPGYDTRNVSSMRLWTAVSNEDFNLFQFNAGDYTGAMDAKVRSENISKVLYPSDEKYEGRVLRLKQQYFLVAATLRDIIRRFQRHLDDLSRMPERVAIQLNDTHPTIAIPEMMRILLDEQGWEWEKAWNLCHELFAYTNHTVLPEALETWPVDLLKQLLPRHLEIIYEINRRFLEEVAQAYPGQEEKLSSLSIIEEGYPKKIRMAHLAIVGSHSINGVAALHSEILRQEVFPHFQQMYPDRFHNVTNGVTPRRWLLQCNPGLSELISKHIGDGWITNLEELEKLRPLASDIQFQSEWAAVKRANKERLIRYVDRKVGVVLDPDSLFDVHIKRIHEYKRQLLNLLHVITLYLRLKKDPDSVTVPRSVIIAGKAAPAYHHAKLIIKLANSVAEKIKADPVVRKRLKLVFLPNYCITQSEKVIPATDLSQQISTAGLEASGTGNMKFGMNGALTLGTLDGANIEMREQIGEDNFFIFGLTAEEVRQLRKQGYDPYHYVRQDPELHDVLESLNSGLFSPDQPDLFRPILNALLEGGDRFMLLADYRSYVDAQDKVSQVYENASEWTRLSILNVAAMGYFSSDRAIAEYARDIWKTRPLNKV